MAGKDVTQWSTSIPFGTVTPPWCPKEDSERIGSYLTYESIYWNLPDAFKVVQRGSDTKPIYIPAARQIVETMQRYVAIGMEVKCDPLLGNSKQQADSLLYFAEFAKRERFYSKFSSNKRYGFIRGDWLFHITGNEELEEGARVSFETIDPAEYFPIYDPIDQITIIGAHLIAPMTNADGDQVMYRQTYRKVTGAGGPSPITVEENLFDLDAWGGPGMEEKGKQVVRPVTQLPDDIQHIPIYHIPNTEEPGSVYGSSELRGIERMLVAINQSISDEELELVLNGLGVYVTDAGSPIDEDTGEPIPWDLGPAKVVELPEGKKFERITGTSSVAPHQDHLRYLHEQLENSTGMNSLSAGRVDVSSAESGIHLLLSMAPLFAKADEKELIIVDVMIQMLFDLKAFFAAYEGQNFDAVSWIPKFGDRLPIDKDKRFDQIMAIAVLDPPVVSGSWIRRELAKIGWEMDSDTKMLKDIVSEREELGAAADAFGAQTNAVLAGAAGAAAAGALPAGPPVVPVADNAAA